MSGFRNYFNSLVNKLRSDFDLHREEDVEIERASTNEVYRSVSVDSDLLEIEVVHLYPRENAKNHHTDRFELVQRTPPVAVLRRGQKFSLVIRVIGRAYNSKNDVFKLNFNFGPNPCAVKGTKGVVTITGTSKLQASSEHWDGEIKSHDESNITVQVRSPPDAPVGVWKLVVETTLKDKPGKSRVYKYHDIMYLLFNPWVKADPVYMDDQKLLDEYVLNDVGKIWVGPFGSARGRQWVFGQFDDAVLPAAVIMLENSGLPYLNRENPIKVARAISRIVNSNDDSGVLMGRWDGNYEDGTAPAAWTGSVNILEEYLKTQKSVRYGQCWVFSGVVNTVCRALGIPARVVSNLVSAHDANLSLTVDKYYDKENEEIEWDPHNPNGGTDSIWNFHVWNDVWMARPDLRKGYGGWQAIDATPQETSDGFFQCGPASLEAVRRGEVGLRYDVPFVVAEVNADLVRWKEDDKSDLGYTKIDTNKYHVGRMVITKMPYIFDPNGDKDLENITSQYKGKEGTEPERLALYNAVRGTERAKRFFMMPSMSTEELKFELEDLDRVPIGESFKLVVNITNNSSSVRTVQAVLSAGSVYYTGVNAQIVKRASGFFKLQPNSKEQLMMSVTPSDYMEKLVEYCIMKIYAIASVEETRQTWADEDDFQVLKPKLDVQVTKTLKLGSPTVVKFSFKNPLRKTLTDCKFRYEGPGLTRTKIMDHRNVGPEEVVQVEHKFVPTRSGNHKLVGTFTSLELVDIVGSAEIEVTDNKVEG